MKKSSVALFGRLTGMGLGYLFVLLIARLYGPDVLGKYSIAFTVLTILGVVGCLGFEHALVKTVAIASQKNNYKLVRKLVKKIIAFCLLCTILLSTFLFLFRLEISMLLIDGRDGTAYVAITSLIAPFLVFVLLASTVFRGLQKVTVYVLACNVLPYLTCVIILPVLSVFFRESYSTLLALLAGYSFATLYLCFKLFGLFKVNGAAYGGQVRLGEQLRLSLPMLVTSSMTMVMGWADILMLGFFLDDSLVGTYTIAVKLASLMSLMLIAVNTAIAPKFAESFASGNYDELKRLVRKSTKIITLISIPIFFVLILAFPFMFSVFGVRSASGELVFGVLLLGQVVNLVCGPVGVFMNMTGYQRELQVSAGISLLVNIVMNILLIPKLGLYGAAISTLVSGVLWNFLCVLFVYLKEKILFFYIPFLERSNDK